MNDKTFDLLEKLYIEFSGRFEKIESELKENRKDIIRMENEFGGKFTALFEAQALTNQRLDRIEKKLDEVSEKVELSLN